MTIPTSTDVLIVGGGPAGVLLGCLLARRGIDVVVTEKQSDLERDFRGETLAAPSAVTLRRLGFGPALDKHGFLQTEGVTMRMEGRDVFSVDYRRFELGVLPIDIPQPALIGMIAKDAREHKSFHHEMSTTCTGLIEKDGAIVGAKFKLRGGERLDVRARLVIGADGRFSKVRKESGLKADITPMARDFLSFKLPRPPEWGNNAQLVVDGDRHLVVLPTFPDFLRVGNNLPKRGLGELRKAGFDAFKQGVAEIDPRLGPLVEDHLHSWDDTGFLEIFTAEVPQWTRDGLLLVGDASHTVTPILGQGVNLAIQDCVTVAPVIAAALKQGTGPIPARVFDEYVEVRRPHKARVTRSQRMQEGQLAESKPAKIFLRRLKFSTLNRLPLKYRLFAGVMTAPHDIDPVDLRVDVPSQPATVG